MLPLEQHPHSHPRRRSQYPVITIIRYNTSVRSRGITILEDSNLARALPCIHDATYAVAARHSPCFCYQALWPIPLSRSSSCSLAAGYPAGAVLWTSVDLLLPVRHRERRPDLDLRISGAVGYLTSRVHNIPVYMEFEGQGILLGNQFCQSLPSTTVWQLVRLILAIK